MCFGLLAAVDSLDFEVEEGEVFGIAGPNGAGKTTLFNVIAGVYRPTGAVFFENKNITNLRADEVCRRGIARTFQIPELFHTLSIRDNVRVGAHFGNTDRRRVNDAMEHAPHVVGRANRRSKPDRNTGLRAACREGQRGTGYDCSCHRAFDESAH